MDYKTIIYIRVSSNKQNNKYNNTTSLETQYFNCQNYCSLNNLTIDTKFEEIASARHLKQKILKMIIENYNNINLIIHDLSRFSRNVNSGLELLQECLNKNIIIHFLKEKLIIKMNDDINICKQYLIATEHESDYISYRIKQSIKYKKSLGYHIGKAKYGFIIKHIDGVRKLEPNNTEQLIITLINKLYYGSQKKDIQKLLHKINKSKLELLDDDIICYGNYTCKDIAYFLNFHNISYKTDKLWTANIINNLLNKNTEYFENKHKLTNDLINELNNKNYNKIKSLYKKINGYNLDDNNIIINNNNDIISFLKTYNVNFRPWDNN